MNKEKRERMIFSIFFFIIFLAFSAFFISLTIDSINESKLAIEFCESNDGELSYLQNERICVIDNTIYKLLKINDQYILAK